jgi:hypothetical protein
VRLAAVTLQECNQGLAEGLAGAVAGCAAIKRADGEFRQLAAIEAVHAAFRKLELATLTPETRSVRYVIELVWMNVFQRYFWLKDQEREHSTG